MADSSFLSTGTADGLEETLARLSKKQGVRATIALDRNTGAILKTSGQVASIRTANTRIPTQNGTFGADANSDELNEMQGVQELSGLVWNFVKAAGMLVDEVDKDDELKLLRLRTKKQELVIVPSSRFLLVVVHDTQPA